MGKKDTVTFEEFKEEIELTDKQYGQEEDLYFLVNKIIRSTLPDDMTVRDVHRLEQSKDYPGRECFRAYGQAPDFVILDKKFKQSEENQSSLVYGCVEVKKFKNSEKGVNKVKNTIKELIEKEDNQNKSVLKREIIENKNTIEYTMKIGEETYKISEDVSELIRECVFFKKVLFTNLKQWFFLKYKYKGDIEKEEDVEKNTISYAISMSDIEITKLYSYSVYDSEKQGKVRFVKLLAELEDINWKQSK